MNQQETQVLAWIVKIGGCTEREIAYKSGLPLETVEAACRKLHELGRIAAGSWTTTEAARAINDAAIEPERHPLDTDSGVRPVTPQVPKKGAGFQPHHEPA